MIRRILVGFTLLVSFPQALLADPWRAVFVTEEGVRFDFTRSKSLLAKSSDKASAYRFEFIIPENESKAMIRLLPVGENTSPSEDYEAIVICRGEDMIVLLMANAGLSRGDKLELYTLYPKLGIGFLTETSAFMGNPLMKTLADSRPDIPAASAKAFPLKRIDK